MADGRQRADWFKIGMAVAFVVNRNGFTKKPLDPLKVIPPQFRPTPEPLPEVSGEERESQSRIAWGILDQFFSRK